MEKSIKKYLDDELEFDVKDIIIIDNKQEFCDSAESGKQLIQRQSIDCHGYDINTETIIFHSVGIIPWLFQKERQKAIIYMWSRLETLVTQYYV